MPIPASARAVPAKVGTGFASGTASQQGDRVFPANPSSPENSRSQQPEEERLEFRIDPFPSETDIGALWSAAWGGPPPRFADILSRSLGHVGAYEGDSIVGFVNIAWDGGVHAFILDTCVHPNFRRQDVATRLVKEAEQLARQRGAHWLHVDFEPHLEAFYRGCGFRPTAAGLIDLNEGRESPS